MATKGASVLSRAEELASEATDEIRSLEVQKAKIDEEIKRLRRFVNVVTPSEKPKSGRRSPSAQYGVGIAGGVVLGVAEAIQGLVREGGRDEVTALEVADFMGANQPKQVYSSFRALRDMEFIAKAGRRKVGDGRYRDFYRILDEDALERVRSNVTTS